MPTEPHLAQHDWHLRGTASFLTGHPVEGTRAFVERERYLSDPALRANREQLFNSIRAAAERGAPMKVPPKSDPIVAGWLQLGPVAVELQRDPMHATAALNSWQAMYPQHPANQSVLALAQSEIAVATEFPDQIALLLPLSGRAEAIGTAVRDGFIAGYLEQDVASRPRVKVYDVAAESVAGAYQHAVQDGASFIVGPLTKEDVAAVAPLAAGRTPVLALNFLADSVVSSGNFYQFALLPEDEARIVARRLAADGKLKGIAIVPDSEWGTRVARHSPMNSRILAEPCWTAAATRPAARTSPTSSSRPCRCRSVKGEPSSHRSDADFVFIAGTPQRGRLIVPQLKFQLRGRHSRVLHVGLLRARPRRQRRSGRHVLSRHAVDGVGRSGDRKIRDAVRGAWPARTARLNRLFAFGFDAYRLVPALRAEALSETNEIAGVTGKLFLDDHNRIRRELDWVQITNGIPSPLVAIPDPPFQRHGTPRGDQASIAPATPRQPVAGSTPMAQQSDRGHCVGGKAAAAEAWRPDI